MADLRRRISHLEGMADRLELREGGREGRMLAEMVDVLREMALDVEEIGANQVDLENYVEELDTDLMHLEEDLYARGRGPRRTRAEGVREADYIVLECPRCNKESSYNPALFEEEGIQLTCPHCGNIVYDSDEDCLVYENEEEPLTS
ncbi:MAG: zinc-ribbon domain-containing protein [Firmicutes bacterium]|nr:hypothetical protein [Alicyclobacillaceae bacterium]MCL6496664.1 zinc-ribbon domain-containing protein [Bacillota bacterium]